MKMLYLNKKFNYLNLHLSLKFSSLFYLLKNIKMFILFISLFSTIKLLRLKIIII